MLVASLQVSICTCQKSISIIFFVHFIVSLYLLRLQLLMLPDMIYELFTVSFLRKITLGYLNCYIEFNLVVQDLKLL